MAVDDDSQTQGPHVETNQVMPDVWNQPIWKTLIPRRLPNTGDPVVVFGTLEQVELVTSALRATHSVIPGVRWSMDGPADLFHVPRGSTIVLCHVPVSAREWDLVKDLRDRHEGLVVGLHELILPFTAVQVAQSKLLYHEPSFEAVVAYYTGQRYNGPIAELDQLVGLQGKTVVELGPMEGLQTAGLVQAGARHVTCVEARAHNFIKLLIARYAFGWDNVDLVMDDFHNADARKYGRFDLAFAHGVYYHSNAPFVLLENLLSLSDTVLLGGFCATDALPVGDYEILEHSGERYRVKPYLEGGFADFVQGVNVTGYVFHGDDLMDFFSRRDYDVTVVSDVAPESFAGRFLVFVARKGAWA